MVVFVGCFFALVVIVLLMNNKREEDRKQQHPIHAETRVQQQTQQYPSFRVPHSDVLLDPYAPPIRYPEQKNFIVPVATNIGAINANYRQIGLITPLNGSSKGEILALLGRPLFTNRRKWQYYAISNQHNNIKLPIRVKGRSASNEYGVDELFDGDVVYVEGKKETFRVTLYENEQIEYVPY
jgi:hypothetical protein